MIVFKNYFGALAKDESGNTVYGFENISAKGLNDFNVPMDGGCMGYVHSGELEIKRGEHNTMTVCQGSYFTTVGGFRGIMGENTRVFFVQQSNYKGVVTIGHVEKEGRLNYIDGCKDTVLHGPLKKGLPVLNALYMPTAIHQTMHTHPSTRAGIIIDGFANCELPGRVIPLEAGLIFFLPKDTEHKFRTDETMGTLRLIAYHPDSDFGPSDEHHPMLQRTIVGGVSAEDIPDIRTKS